MPLAFRWKYFRRHTAYSIFESIYYLIAVQYIIHAHTPAHNYKCLRAYEPAHITSIFHKHNLKYFQFAVDKING